MTSDIPPSSDLASASDQLNKKMALGRVPLIVMGSGMSAGVFAPTMAQIHSYLKIKVETAAAADPDNNPVFEAVLSLLRVLVPSPASLATAVDSPRSVQVRLYHLLQTSTNQHLNDIWRDFGNDLLRRKMVQDAGGSAFDPNATLANLRFSSAHAWAAKLAIRDRAVVASLNYDGLTRKAIDSFATTLMLPPPTDRLTAKERRTSRIISTSAEIRSFFAGEEIDMTSTDPAAEPLESGIPKAPWRPIPVIKFRGDVFHAICLNGRCPVVGQATPLYFVMPTESEKVDPGEIERALCCGCCRYPRRLQISFPGVFNKEVEIDDAVAAFHQFFGSRLAGIVFLGFSGAWDESLVDYLAARAAVLDVPIVSVSQQPTPALKEAALRHGGGIADHYFYIRYQSVICPLSGEAGDSVLDQLISPQSALVIRRSNTLPSALAFPPEMTQSLVKEEIFNVVNQRGIAFKIEVKTCEETPAEVTDFKVRQLALGTGEFKRLKACSQMGIKSLLLRETKVAEHNRFQHSAGANAIARIWFELLRATTPAPPGWSNSDEAGLALEMAVLFHDALHLPFSHMMEEVFRELNWGHRPAAGSPTIPRYTLADGPDFSRNPEFKSALEARLAIQSGQETRPEDWWPTVRALQRGRSGFAWLEAIVDSALDADKIEYIFNDTQRSGRSVRLGNAQAWLKSFFSGQSLTPEGLIRLEGESCAAALALLEERAHLYRTLYLAPELRGLECLSRYIVLTWLKWKVPDALVFADLQSKQYGLDAELKAEKSRAAGDLLWELFSNPHPRTRMAPANELEGVEHMVVQLCDSNGLGDHLDPAARDWLKQLWRHLEPFGTPAGPSQTLQRAFEALSPRGPLYVNRDHEGTLRKIARRFRVHYPLLGLIDIATFPRFLATPQDRWTKIGNDHLAAEQFLVPGTHPNEWHRQGHATVPLHQCDFDTFERPITQVLILDPHGDASGGGAFLDEMFRRELQRQGIPFSEDWRRVIPRSSLAYSAKL